MGIAQVISFLLVCWVPCAWGVRSESNDLLELATEATSSFIKNTQTVCLLETGPKISCKDFEGTIIDVKTAFRNTASMFAIHEAHKQIKEAGGYPMKGERLFREKSKKRCQKSVPPLAETGVQEDCEAVDVTDDVRAQCDGKVACSLDDWGAKCPKFIMMRIVFDCVKGTEETADQDIERHQLDGDTIPVKASTSSSSGIAKEVSTTSSSVQKTEEEAFAEKTAEERAHDVVKRKQEEEDIELGFNPCYRYTRLDKIMNNKWFEYLTSCPKQEGCFRLLWADKSVEYTDSEVPPSPKEIAQAELSRHDDSSGYFNYFFGSTTWFSTGLERNHYNTWGICLPKNDGMDEAVAFFKAMKKR